PQPEEKRQADTRAATISPRSSAGWLRRGRSASGRGPLRSAATAATTAGSGDRRAAEAADCVWELVVGDVVEHLPLLAQVVHLADDPVALVQGGVAEIDAARAARPVDRKAVQRPPDQLGLLVGTPRVDARREA